MLEQLRAHCLSKEGAVEDYPWGDIVWKVRGKLFAGTNQAGEAVTVKSSLDKQAVLIQHPDIEVAKYVGKYGWVTITLASNETLDLALELIDESYDAVFKKKR